MPRKQSWDLIPCLVDNPKVTYSVLREWGVDLPLVPGRESSRKGWQKVRLPPGWLVKIESGNVYLLDNRNQIRGTIKNLLPFTKSATFLEDGSNPVRIRRKPVKLYLQTAINIRYVHTMGVNGPYALYAEDSMGGRLVGYNEVYITDDEADETLKKMHEDLERWLDTNYPDWKSPTAYWDTFD
jgi:hypothetical protein